MSLGIGDGLKEMLQPGSLQVVGNQRSGRRFGFQTRKPNSQDKSSGSSRKPQIGGKRNSGLGNQGQPEQLEGSKWAQRNFEQWPLCNKCKGQHLGDCNDS